VSSEIVLGTSIELFNSKWCHKLQNWLVYIMMIHIMAIIGAKLFIIRDCQILIICNDFLKKTYLLLTERKLKHFESIMLQQDRLHEGNFPITTKVGFISKPNSYILFNSL